MLHLIGSVYIVAVIALDLTRASLGNISIAVYFLPILGILILQKITVVTLTLVDGLILGVQQHCILMKVMVVGQCEVIIMEKIKEVTKYFTGKLFQRTVEVIMDGGIIMNKKFLAATFLSVLSTFTYADNHGLGAITVAPSGEDPGLQAFIDEHNLPQPGSGIQIVPYATSSMAKLKSFEKAIDQDGNNYVKQKSDDAISLLKLDENKYYPGTKKTYESSDPMDSHIKASLSLIKLAFPFHKISFVRDTSVIGYAVGGQWSEGWTGVGEVFKHANGICRYDKDDVSTNGASVRLIKEYVTYDINKKPTVLSAEGLKSTGISYKIDWYDNDYFHSLTCANKSFSKEDMQTFIALAKKIDADQNS